jgi:uncharacterized protein (UPF0335 family)
MGETAMEMTSQQKLFNHVRSLERLEEAKKDAAADYNERLDLAKKDGFDADVIKWVLKRRKAGDGQTMTFDDLTAEYEEALRSQKTMQFDDTKVIISSGGRSIETTASELAEVAESFASDSMQ